MRAGASVVGRMRDPSPQNDAAGDQDAAKDEGTQSHPLNLPRSGSRGKRRRRKSTPSQMPVQQRGRRAEGTASSSTVTVISRLRSSRYPKTKRDEVSLGRGSVRFQPSADLDGRNDLLDDRREITLEPAAAFAAPACRRARAADLRLPPPGGQGWSRARPALPTRPFVRGSTGRSARGAGAGVREAPHRNLGFRGRLPTNQRLARTGGHPTGVQVPA